MGLANKVYTPLPIQGRTSTDVLVWRASLQQPPIVVEKLHAVLSKDESKRAEKFHFASDRESFIIARGVLRILLSQYIIIEPQQLQFEYSSTGKPFLSNSNGSIDLSFNLSHSGDFALFAFCRGARIGIDIERIRPIEDIEQIAERNFSNKEFKELKSLNGDMRLHSFFNCWTRKEAFIKAIGEGLSFPLQEFDVSVKPDEPAKLLSLHGNQLEAARWSMIDLQPTNNYAAALVVENTRYSISYRDWIDHESFNTYWS